MSKSDNQQPESQTGAVPKLDFPFLSKRREPPRPVTLPDFPDDSGSITGAINIRTEGEDKAKYADDTPTRSALTS